MKHLVKSWTFLFEPIYSGAKTHDLRILDREYAVGDVLVLQEYDYGAKKYTGRETEAEITFITSAANACAFSPVALHPKFGILSIRKLA